MTLRLFISYSHKDEHYLDRFHVHLAQSMREGVFQGWYDREIDAGADIDNEVAQELELADIYVALVSPDFINSNYCYNVELQRALERQKHGTMVVVPVIIEACDWQSTPLGKLKALPKDGKAIAEWTNENVAYLDVIKALRKLQNSVVSPFETKAENSRIELIGHPQANGPKSKFRIKKNFGQIDRQNFKSDAFKEISDYFEKSIEELNGIDGIKAKYIDQSPTTFGCIIENLNYSSTKTIWVTKSSTMGDISIRYGADPSDNSSNGMFVINHDEYELYFDALMFHFHEDQKHLDANAVAELIWNDLLKSVGIEIA